jgi:primosomal protein N' (replication factor Y)
MFAKVIVDVAHSSVDRIFEYGIPEELPVAVGHRVLVPFGAGNKPVEGYVIGVSEKCEIDEKSIKPVLRLMEEYEALTKGQIALAAWIREYYHTPLAIALRLMFPAELRGERIREKKQTLLVLAAHDAAAVQSGFYTKDGKVKAPNKLALYQLLTKQKSIGTEKLPEGLRASVAAAVKEGWAVKEERELQRKPLSVPEQPKSDFTLSPWQEEALAAIAKGMETGGRFLLHGVTGSGKTEVYIRAIEQARKQGKTAIMLVPEISLTPQMTEMFKRRLCEDIAVLHSGLSAGERFDEWRRIRKGISKVVIGARSAVFAPLTDIGLIIMDEEHESSYKSDIHPKYQTHEIAIKRAEIEQCALVLGSATPSVETYHAALRGQYRLLKMPKRLFDLELPKIEIADMREELKAGNRTIFSGRLYEAILETLSENRQAMLFINRRGHSTFVMCRGCGYVEYCGDCAVTMTYHSATDELKCHYCGRTRPVRSVCPECGKPYLKLFGIGTQKVEEEVKKRFPEARVLRMDLDTLQKKDEHFRIYERFKKGGADILVGTQMIAKGFDFENVSLVGVIAADTSLYFPDYRSAERTFQLIEQVSGRSGRRGEGLVVVQTYVPEHYAIQYAARHDYEGFYEKEAGLRAKSFLPPFGLFIRFIFSGADEKIVEEAAADFKTGLEQCLKPYGSSVLLLEAGPAPIRKIEGRTRYQILLKLKNDYTKKPIKGILYEYTNTKKYSGCNFGLEINPLSLT